MRPPEGAPNVLVVLLDDVGFGAASAFGGPCRTPTAEKLAAGRLNYTRFHATALCAPTRKALLSGRNHHSPAMGSTTATAAPGQVAAVAVTVAVSSSQGRPVASQPGPQGHQARGQEGARQSYALRAVTCVARGFK
jgi:hypothetical protein